MLLLIQAIVLGLLQGLTEFLPVSSSGHLQGVPFLLGWDASSLAFDVMVHAGTLIAVLAHFRRDLLAMGIAAFGLGADTPDVRRDARILIGLLALGTLPAALAGLFLADVFEAAFSSPRAVAFFLYVTALLLWAAERIRTRRIATAPIADAHVPATSVADGTSTRSELAMLDVGRSVASMRGRDALLIGLAQAFAIFPGVSRAGATMAAGMSLGLSRTAAARFSFLMSIPIILGATLVTLLDLGATEAGTLPFGPLEIVVGVVVAAASGYAAIRYLLALVARRDLLVFARYVVAFGTVLLAATFIVG